ncbi:hypothetical protein BDV95DRAFT_629420 [Massariosphaeria phaeospora]|uniref:SET domain-containing protein n=1 Tax=Massariosphaeria phaeospora TaxID=100035 RepID=A0A7C8I617_9PLEO|nr:hypothetical protein BDV95DRAFT_629420 [Massariosphaeria phaeospora]
MFHPSLHHTAPNPSRVSRSPTPRKQFIYINEAYASAHAIPDFPWTFYPSCFANENTTSPYCVFSDQTFARGRGIFIVTTPSQAYDLLASPAFTDASVLDSANDFANPPFEQRALPGKGRGLIANTTLHRGTQIFASTPLLITDPGAYSLSTSERLALLHRGVATLPPDSQARFWTLLNHFQGDAVDDRIDTNAFEIAIDGVTQYAVLPETALLNHDCRPNAAYFWDEAALMLRVHATQTIYPGEEISITYIDNERPRAARTAHLQRNWGFACGCAACAAPEFVTAESDARILQIQEVAALLDDWSEESCASPEMAMLLVSLYEQERLGAGMGKAYRLAAEVYSSFGERWLAVKFARLSVEVGALDKGWGDGDVLDMVRMAEEPEGSWSWGRRVGLRRGEGCGWGA